MPLMGKKTIPECERFFRAINHGGTREIHPYPVPALVLGQYLIYRNSYKFSGSVLEPEPHRCNLPIRISAGNHLHRDIYAQYAFQS